MSAEDSQHPEAPEGDSSLTEITERLQALATELASAQDEERAAELVREASKLVAEAGQSVDRALGGGGSAAAEQPEPPA